MINDTKRHCLELNGFMASGPQLICEADSFAL